MNQAKNNSGASKLAQVLDSRISAMGQRPPVLELGTMQAGGRVLADSYPYPVPCLVCRGLTLGASGGVLTKTADGQHQVKVPESLRSVQPGDRVLLAWLCNDPVVIDLVSSFESKLSNQRFCTFSTQSV